MQIQTNTCWTVHQAKTHLSTILRKARAGEPQVIGTKNQCVLIPIEEFQKKQRMSLGAWLVEEGPKVGLGEDDLILPSRHDDRPMPFVDY